MIAMKFGGTSLGDADRIKNAANIIISMKEKKPVAVVSAVSKITDMLIKLGYECEQGSGQSTFDEIKKKHLEILEKLGLDKSILDNDFQGVKKTMKQFMNKKMAAKTMDSFQSFGERMSSKIVAATVNKLGEKSKAYDAWDVGLITDSEFCEAHPLAETYENLRFSLSELEEISIVTGFIAKNKEGDITTMGRGGSDFTAAIIGAALKADEIQIWTDVNGIMSTDPRVVKEAKTLPYISFAEASELAYFGAKVLHPKTILPAMEKGIPVKVLNTFNPEGKGTIILDKYEHNHSGPKSVCFKKNIMLMNIASTRMLGAHGFLASLFEVFKKHKKSVDVISTSEVSVSLTVDSYEGIDSILKDLAKIANVNLFNNKSIICVVGEGINENPKTMHQTFSALDKNGIKVEMVSMGASKINVSMIVDGKETEKTVKVLHKEYFGG